MKNNRCCIVSKEKMCRDNLIRVVRTNEGEFHISNKIKGRGAYVSKVASFSKVLKKRLLNRSFKQNVPQKTYDELEQIMRG